MKYNNILVTGGAGFIGSAFIRLLADRTDFQGRIVNLDLLTYAGNLENLQDSVEGLGDSYHFVQGDIRDMETAADVFRRFDIDCVVHFAAESHVDRSIPGPKDFVTTNIVGTFTLLEAARTAWAGRQDVRFHHVSTDEVFGSLGEEGFFVEDSPYDPRSPYSASKASSDHLVRAYFHTYGLPVTVSNCSNNYGPYQFPEKLIPVTIEKALAGEPLPVYGDGLNIRDWLYVDDHVRAICRVLDEGRFGDTYNIGGHYECTNIALVHLICDLLAEFRGVDAGTFRELVTFVTDRPGHDRRYAIDASKIADELGWTPAKTLESGMRETVEWYLNNRDWIDRVKSGEYRTWMERNYSQR